MTGQTTIVTGIEVPSVSPVFLTVVGFHVVVGMACVIAGIIAMLSKKQAGRHPTLGTIYYWCLSAVFASATALAVVRWAEDYHLFILGTLSFGAASLGRAARRQRWRSWVRLHITGMGLSYIFLLTAFYVDNGHSLPLWKELPPIAYWFVPGAGRDTDHHPGLDAASTATSPGAPRVGSDLTSFLRVSCVSANPARGR
jgi:lysylphosphatidylglycerol synthetase-like protein (DUF2156 family)